MTPLRSWSMCVVCCGLCVVCIVCCLVVGGCLFWFYGVFSCCMNYVVVVLLCLACLCCLLVYDFMGVDWCGLFKVR